MFHPTRGGTRGGAAEFSWEDVRKDKDRENYLGHSIQAPTGRWQNHKDVHWYNKSLPSGEKGDADALNADQIARRQELQAIKEREQAEIERRLGRKPGSIGTGSSASVGDALLRGSAPSSSIAHGTGANSINFGSGAPRSWGDRAERDARDAYHDGSGLTREERRAARKLAKMEVRERHKRESGDVGDERRGERKSHRHRHRSRSRSRDRSRSPESRRDERSRYHSSKSSRRRYHSRSRSPEERHRGQTRYREIDRTRGHDHHQDFERIGRKSESGRVCSSVDL